MATILIGLSLVLAALGGQWILIAVRCYRDQKTVSPAAFSFVVALLLFWSAAAIINAILHNASAFGY